MSQYDPELQAELDELDGPDYDPEDEEYGPYRVEKLEWDWELTSTFLLPFLILAGCLVAMTWLR